MGQTYHVKGVVAIAHDWRALVQLLAKVKCKRTDGAVVAWKLALGTRAVELDATNTADFIFGHVPSPRRYCVPGNNFDLHSVVVG